MERWEVIERHGSQDRSTLGVDARLVQPELGNDNEGTVEQVSLE